MEVECNFFGPVRDVVGTKTVVCELPVGATVAELVCDLDETYDGLADQLLEREHELAENLVITVDGRNVQQLDGGETELDDGAVVRISPSVGGGG
ncbi:ubiquitin-like small modifier protein 1 [Halalkaliarchaeum sp. AArc-GB]|uniref:ubiquitin-like small modifier protein 1 n=1 Tax=Halalkaliarchaeum sp. AArc-GB TaxID=3074078 RepID=UPI0028667CAE|nr:ubiquitin-like small modifier protein 1 [Halalkaliarchaeum sp. AArc-GB]MDR5673820.1 ubiquitin-like small modifier protein 1 [Halalkaliarchaeum sp. AArc-GB]